MSKRSENRKLIDRLRAVANRIEDGEQPDPKLARSMADTLADWADRLSGAQMTMSVVEEYAGTSGSVQIWCDGSCAPNPGRGGWGAIIERDGKRKELSGAAPESTNNIMEMTAAIEALGHTPPGAEVHITTDSQYLRNGITRWIHGWKRKGWRKADGSPVLNRELWNELDRLSAGRRVTWHWVRGHSGHPENERCDELASLARLAQ